MTIKTATDAANNAYNVANNAYNAVNNASSYAQQAKSSADSAANNALNAYNAANNAAIYTWDSSEAKSAATLAKEARDKANQALTEITNVKNTVNNIQASIGPQIFKVTGQNGATCTTGTSFTVVIQATNAVQWRAKVDSGGTWSSWASITSPITLSVSSTGAHTIFVEAQNSSGVTATGQMIMFKI